MSISRLSLLLFLAIFATSIQAETINCTPITSVPATITAQGIYCLTGNLSTSQASGNAITINANNVTLDLNGWKVGGQGAGIGTTATGIYSAANNVTIKNGIVRGFFIGIQLSGSGDVVQDVLSDTNYYVSIWLTGPGAVVEHNLVVNTGGIVNDAFGIASSGSGATISDNIVSGITPGSGYQGQGISVNSSDTTIRNNVVSNASLPSSGSTYGIVNFNPSITTNNTVNIFTVGIDNAGGGIYSFNTVNGCTTAFSGGTAGAGNSND